MMGGWNPPSSDPILVIIFKDGMDIWVVFLLHISHRLSIVHNAFSHECFFMENPPPTYDITSGWNQFSNMRNPPHGVPSSGGNGYPHMDNPYHITFSLQAFPSGMIPSQPFISPTSASHVGDRSTTSASHVEDLQPAVASHVGGTTLVTASHTRQTSPTSASHVGDQATSLCKSCWEHVTSHCKSCWGH
jgi:hypothetical protein